MHHSSPHWESPRRALRAWTLSWLAYAIYYVGRKGFSVSKKTMAAEFGLSEATLGGIDTAYLIAYTVGQFTSGWLGDRIGARRLLGYGLLGSGLACAAFGFGSSASVFAVSFLINGLFQATGWPGAVRAMSEWTTPKNRGTVMAFWATCYQVGGVVANALCAYFLVHWGFRSAFWGPALILGSMGLALLRWLEAGRSEQTPLGSAGSEQPASAAKDQVPSAGPHVSAAQLHLLRNPFLWSYGASYFFIKFIRYTLLFWLPYYLSTQHAYAADVAANVSSAFELGGVVGVIALGTLSDRLPALSRAVWSALSLLGLAAALFLYIELASRGWFWNAAGLALIGALLFGPDALLSGAAAQDAGGARAAAMAGGMVNGLGSLGAIAEGLVVPRLSARLGWPALFPTLVVLALAAAFCLLPARRLRASTD
ncbi:MAG TPA: MFS transporter [Polyangiaceae bacterium]|nr:MFS transporter [Polyangiaceae bacterium]